MNLRKNRISKEEYLRRFSIHNGKYNYLHIDFSKLKIYDKITIECPIHGTFIQTVRDHTKGDGCKKCNSIEKSIRQKDNLDNFIKKAQKLHNNYYIYDKTIYGKNAHDKVIITCPIHGDFKQSPNKHLLKRGCPACNTPNKLGVYKKMLDDYKKYENDFIFLYYCKLSNKDEEFYKIGVTNINKLYNRMSRFPYKIDFLFIKKLNILEALRKESEIKTYFKSYMYKPKIKFNGSTECFYKDIIYNKTDFEKINYEK